MHVTKCQRNVLLEIDGRTPFEVLKEVFEGLTERDRQLAQNSLFLGVVMDELIEEPRLGDYLIRNIIGVDPRQGVIAVGEMMKEGQTVQFHLRDANTSSEDLDAMLSNYVSGRPTHEESGALLFSCLGRGSYLYGRADHDTNMFLEKVGTMPLTGFFCNGEIGPVGGSTFLHGYTSSFGIFRPMQGE
jgi:small ligand-binding sensory domain FIST